MYGLNVHKKSLKKQRESRGVTFHFVNEEYDKGKIIHQENVLFRKMKL